jgi:hypothetical protein
MSPPQEDPGGGYPQTFRLHSNPTANSAGTQVAFRIWVFTLTKA